MKAISLRMAFVHLVVALFLSGLQTSMWPGLLGNIPAPQFWLCWVLYLGLYRGFLEAVFMSYVFGLMMTSMTSLHLKVIWFSLFTLVALTSFARNKVFWPGLRYFMIASFLMAVGWNVCTLFYTTLLEPQPAAFELLARGFEIALTTMVSPLVYVIMTWLEKFRPDDTATAAGTPL
ncbi:MAG: hypothetical protein KF767_07820 [Bdellovibrionaceae bacterium]|nr:hypothetical protein [Pseudobdellovibrionaceae bacterium]